MSQWSPHPLLLVSLYDQEIWTHSKTRAVHAKRRPLEATAKRQPATRQEERNQSREKSKLLTSWCGASSLQNGKKIIQSVVFCYGSSSKLTQPRETNKQKILEKNKVGGPLLHSSLKATVIKTLWTDGRTDLQTSGTELRVQKQTHTFMANWFLIRVSSSIKGKGTVALTDDAGDNSPSTCNENEAGHPTSLHIQKLTQMDTCIWMEESLHCSPETTTTLLIGYTPTQNKV